jgi:hypothetical protein
MRGAGGISGAMVWHGVGPGSSWNVKWGLLRGTNGPPIARESGATALRRIEHWKWVQVS